MNKASCNARRPSALIQAVLLSTLLMAASAAFAKDKKVTPPDEPGPYSIGHTTVILNDASRSIDGSTPVTDDGRYLHLDI